MSSRSFAWTKKVVTLLLIALVFLPGTCPVQGQLFVTDGDYISEYTLFGVPVKSHLFEVRYAMQIAADPAGYLYVSEDSSHKVWKYTVGGELVKSWNAPELYTPWPVALDGKGHLYVGYTMADTVGKFTTEGDLVSQFRAGFVTALALDGNGHMFVADDFRGTISEYLTDGTLVKDALITGLNLPKGGLALDSEGYLYVSSATLGTVQKYKTDGSLVDADLISGLDQPVALALDGTGHLFVSCLDGTVGKYSTDGSPIQPALITGLTYPMGLTIMQVPEPSAAVLLLLGILAGRFRGAFLPRLKPGARHDRR